MNNRTRYCIFALLCALAIYNGIAGISGATLSMVSALACAFSAGMVLSAISVHKHLEIMRLRSEMRYLEARLKLSPYYLYRYGYLNPTPKDDPELQKLAKRYMVVTNILESKGELY